MPVSWRRGFPLFEAWREIIAETLLAAARTKSIGSICHWNLTGKRPEAGWAGLCDGSGGGGGIRTPGTLAGPTVFKTARFDRSRTPPLLILSVGAIYRAICDTWAFSLLRFG